MIPGTLKTFLLIMIFTIGSNIFSSKEALSENHQKVKPQTIKQTSPQKKKELLVHFEGQTQRLETLALPKESWLKPPLKEPKPMPYVPPIKNATPWSEYVGAGVYVGVHGSFSFGSYNFFRNIYPYPPNVNGYAAHGLGLGAREFTYGLEGFGGGAYMGVGASFGFAYIGYELNASYINAKTKLAAFPNQSSYMGPTIFYIRTSLKSILSNALRLGVYAAPETLMFIKLGHGLGQFKIDSDTPIDNNFTHAHGFTKYVHGLIYGGGIETSLNPALSFRVEFQHFHSFKIKKASLYTGQLEWNYINYTGTQNDKMFVRSNQFNIGMTYSFHGGKPLSAPQKNSVATGIYGGIAYVMSNFQLGVKDFSRINPHSIQYTFGETGLAHRPSIYGGISFLFEKIFLALETQHIIFTRYTKQTLGTDTYQHFNDGTGNTTANSQYKFRNSLQAALRAGWLLNNRTILYTKVGYATIQVEHSANATGPYMWAFTNAGPIFKNYKTQFHGFLLGGGVEAFIGRHLSLRLDYTKEFFKTPSSVSKHYNFSGDRQGPSNKEVIQPSGHTVSIGLTVVI